MKQCCRVRFDWLEIPCKDLQTNKILNFWLFGKQGMLTQFSTKTAEIKS